MVVTRLGLCLVKRMGSVLHHLSYFPVYWLVVFVKYFNFSRYEFILEFNSEINNANGRDSSYVEPNKNQPDGTILNIPTHEQLMAIKRKKKVCFLY